MSISQTLVPCSDTVSILISGHAYMNRYHIITSSVPKSVELMSRNKLCQNKYWLYIYKLISCSKSGLYLSNLFENITHNSMLSYGYTYQIYSKILPTIQCNISHGTYTLPTSVLKVNLGKYNHNLVCWYQNELLLDILISFMQYLS